MADVCHCEFFFLRNDGEAEKQRGVGIGAGSWGWELGKLGSWEVRELGS